MYYTFSFPREYMSHSGPTLECDSALTTTQYLQPSFARVCFLYVSTVLICQVLGVAFYMYNAPTGWARAPLPYLMVSFWANFVYSIWTPFLLLGS